MTPIFMLLVAIVFADKPPMKVQAPFPSQKVCLEEAVHFMNLYDADDVMAMSMKCVAMEPDKEAPHGDAPKGETF